MHVITVSNFTLDSASRECHVSDKIKAICSTSKMSLLTSLQSNAPPGHFLSIMMLSCCMHVSGQYTYATDTLRANHYVQIVHTRHHTFCCGRCMYVFLQKSLLLFSIVSAAAALSAMVPSR